MSDIAVPPKENESRWRTVRWAVVIGCLIAIASYLAVVVLNESLRRDYFVQRITTFVLIVATAILLGALFKNVATIQLPASSRISGNTAGAGITLVGGIAILYVLLGPVTNLVFPKDQTISGNIFYKADRPDEGLRAVEGVIVQVPETDQRSQPTSKDGRFTIIGLSFHPTDLNAIFSETFYPFTPAKYTSGRYDVIPKPPSKPDSQATTIAAGEWIESGPRCQGVDTRGYRKLSLFVLQKAIPIMPGYKSMVIKVAAQSPNEIADAQKERPDNGYEDQLNADRSLNRQWSVPIAGSSIEWKLTICLGRKAAGPAPARNSLTTTYWFEP
ncbi:MAG TPA: hypothetical protein VEV42_11450 [Pyrinomonadaceae bacterium]|nr:hypothetical protein [Pyrinomonadaceae bacterium]